jgi:hypothetical protein
MEKKMKLHQHLAVLDGAKTRMQKVLTSLLREEEKAGSFVGVTRDYKPADDDGEQFPPENKKVARNAADILDEGATDLTKILDLVLTQDEANNNASADIAINGEVLAKAVPVTTMLFLLKRLEDMRSLLVASPVLPPEKDWAWSDTHNCFISGEEKSRKTARTHHSKIMCEPTDHHPAQIHEWEEAVTIGHTHIRHLSGGLKAEDKADKLARIDAMITAVKVARGCANDYKVNPRKIGKPIFDYILKGAKLSAQMAPEQG